MKQQKTIWRRLLEEEDLKGVIEDRRMEEKDGGGGRIKR